MDFANYMPYDLIIYYDFEILIWHEIAGPEELIAVIRKSLNSEERRHPEEDVIVQLPTGYTDYKNLVKLYVDRFIRNPK